MCKEILFEEVQDSCKKSIRDFFKVTTGLFAVALTFNLIKQKSDINELTTGLFAGLLACALVSIFTSTKMVTQIRKDGIYVRFPPFQPTFSKYSWNNIRQLYLRKYDPINEYYGWGIKAGQMGKGYIVSGETGIQIELSDNTKILIGTQRPDELADVLRDLKKFT